MEIDNLEERVCVVCTRECGMGHVCCRCQQPCHAICGTAEEEGFGKPVVCNTCKAKGVASHPVETSERDEKKTCENAFKVLMSRKKSSSNQTESRVKRFKSGHEKTRMAFCLNCFEDSKKNPKKRFWLSRFNKSTVHSHYTSVHSTVSNPQLHRVYGEDDPRVADAATAYRKKNKKLSTEPLKGKSPVHGMDVQLVLDDAEPVNVQTLSDENEKTIDDEKEQTEGGRSSERSLFKQQPLFKNMKTLDSAGLINVDEFAEKVAMKVARILGSTSQHKQDNVKEVDIKSNASNITEFLKEFTEFEVITDENLALLRCRLCFSYLSNPIGRANCPAGSTSGSLALGLSINDETYQKLLNGQNEKWYHQKAKFLQHLCSETHSKSLLFDKQVLKREQQKTTVVKNQLRIAIGIVKNRCAAMHYESRIAELFAAGGLVGDFGHSRKLFPDMLKVACSYIDEKVTEFLSSPLPNTGLRPHFYVTADKSTNHRVTNQVTLVCPVVNGVRQGIPVSMEPVYKTFDGTGGTANVLAEKVLSALSSHINIEGYSLMQLQGKVFDGQYVTGKFISEMNKPIMAILTEAMERGDCDTTEAQNGFWWPCQWDAGHWLDKVFSKFADGPFVSRLLKRSNLYHQLFGHGKMHSVAFKTSEELKLPFKVTNAYAHQRFLSSSFLSLKNLEKSLEVYIESFKDHDNRLDLAYKLYGQDFIIDLLGLLDLLCPLAILMLQVQAQWCPSWKVNRYVPMVEDRFRKFSKSVVKTVPDADVCPRLHKHIENVRNFKYGTCELEVGWLVVGGGNEKPFEWKAREIADCQDELKALSEGMLLELSSRFTGCHSEMNSLLSATLDFGNLFDGLCGSRQGTQHPVNKRTFASLGADEFQRCVEYVSSLPHVAELNLDLTPELSTTVYWRMKSVLIEIVWGHLFEQYFPKFFKVVKKVAEKPGEAVDYDVDIAGLTLGDDVTHVINFQRGKSKVFTLADVYEVQFNTGCPITVVLQEDRVIQSIYNDSVFYSSIGREFCILFDIMYAKTGSEAVAESFYRVVENQEMDGRQSIGVLSMRSKVDWCFLSSIQCENALLAMAQLYINGDKARGLRVHYVPIYSSQRSRQTHEVSKVIDRLQKEPVKFPCMF